MNKKEEAIIQFLKLIYQEKDIILKYNELVKDMDKEKLDVAHALKNEHTKIFNEGMRIIGKKYQNLSKKLFVGFFFKETVDEKRYEVKKLLKCTRQQCLNYEKLLKNKYLNSEIKRMIKNHIIPRYFTMIDLCKEINRGEVIEVKVFFTPDRMLMHYA